MKKRKTMMITGRIVAIEYMAWKVTGRLSLLAMRQIRYTIIWMGAAEVAISVVKETNSGPRYFLLNYSMLVSQFYEWIWLVSSLHRLIPRFLLLH